MRTDDRFISCIHITDVCGNALRDTMPTMFMWLHTTDRMNSSREHCISVAIAIDAPQNATNIVLPHRALLGLCYSRRMHRERHQTDNCAVCECCVLHSRHSSTQTLPNPTETNVYYSKHSHMLFQRHISVSRSIQRILCLSSTFTRARKQVALVHIPTLIHTLVPTSQTYSSERARYIHKSSTASYIYSQSFVRLGSDNTIAILLGGYTSRIYRAKKYRKNCETRKSNSKRRG